MCHSRIRALYCLVTFLTMCSAASADVKLPAVISDHMVLQRDMPVPVWGWAEAGETVTVQFAGQNKSAKADETGRWSVQLDRLQAGGPHTLTIQGAANSITVQDVLVGEVWLGSGQSNMAMTVNRCRDAEREAAAAELPQIRVFTEKSTAAKEPQTIGNGSWVICSPQTVGAFSATLFFMGRELHAHLKTPVGLINSSVGGTPIESWIDAEAQRATPELKPLVGVQEKADAIDVDAAKERYERALAAWRQAAAKAKAEGKPAPRRPQDPLAARERRGNIGGLFNGKIAPLIPTGIRGVVWYQGEANSSPDKAKYYQYQLPLLVKDWRKRWGRDDLPFAWVQLPNFEGAGRDWPTVREAMLKTLALPHTGMAITIDIGEAKDIHPKNKQDVGRRLAAWALASVYEREVVPSGPLPQGHKVEGAQIRVTFAHATGLTARGGEPAEFEICSDDARWVPAKAKIDGNAMVVSHPDISKPVAVRYAWSNNPAANMFNAAGLPMSPFRLGSVE